MTNDERNAAMLQERIGGATWLELAEKYRLTGQRCQQICIAAAKAGKATNEQIRYSPKS